jgi:hypothetical protein
MTLLCAVGTSASPTGSFLDMIENSKTPSSYSDSMFLDNDDDDGDDQSGVGGSSLHPVSPSFRIFYHDSAILS